MLQEDFDLLGIQIMQHIFHILSIKKKTWIFLLLTINVKWKGIAEVRKHGSFSCFLRFAIHSFCFVSVNSFSQANFTFGFVENLKTYSEAWLRVPEVLKTSGNVFTVS